MKRRPTESRPVPPQSKARRSRRSRAPSLGGLRSAARASDAAPAALPWLLTMDEVAALLRTTRKAVYAMPERGQLVGVTRVGRRLLTRRDDLLSWLDEKRAASPGGSGR